MQHPQVEQKALETEADLRNKHLIYAFIRRKRRSEKCARKDAFICAYRDDNGIRIGWSALNPLDKFDPSIAKIKAYSRAINMKKFEEQLEEQEFFIPIRVADYIVNEFRPRMMSYFKCTVEDFPEWVRDPFKYVNPIPKVDNSFYW